MSSIKESNVLNDVSLVGTVLFYRQTIEDSRMWVFDDSQTNYRKFQHLAFFRYGIPKKCNVPNDDAQNRSFLKANYRRPRTGFFVGVEQLDSNQPV